MAQFCCSQIVQAGCESLGYAINARSTHLANTTGLKFELVFCKRASNLWHLIQPWLKQGQQPWIGSRRQCGNCNYGGLQNGQTGPKINRRRPWRCPGRCSCRMQGGHVPHAHGLQLGRHLSAAACKAAAWAATDNTVNC